MIGLLGGTFDPIHLGHLRIAEELSELMGFDQIRFIPAAIPPHKSAPEVSVEQRVAMVQLAIENNQRFILDTLELDRIGPSYTIETLKIVRNQIGETKSLSLIMGTDAFAKFDTWHEWRQILHYSHIVLVERPYMNADPQEKPILSRALKDLLHAHYTEHIVDLKNAPYGHIIMQQVTWLDISATRIRRYLHENKSIQYLVPDSVSAFIKSHKLYHRTINDL